MKSTQTTLKLFDDEYTAEDGDLMLDGFALRFALSAEDWDIFKRLIMPNLPNCDYADGLLAMLTYGIHKAYEDVEGKPFTLRMDRKPN